ncbi:hypothetical protein HII31_01966 [Pseudocercospora fuligena]|uniref:Uncharacterized protein n=1 Tax=Pseudocercospora fuligena TaxID=685502 RepID=A0A8H6RUS9_9PEZI|nr:hypothetical protein HII31_01966 [Pseudocercospora fuligena]
MANYTSDLDRTNATMSLEERIQRLAQELQDIIFDCYVLTVPSEQTIDITTTHQAPKQLQINSASRAIAAKHYYSTNTFVIDGFNKLSATVSWLRGFPAGGSFDQHCFTLKWFRSLPAEHSFMMETLSFPEPFDYMEGFSPESNLQYRYDLMMEGLKESSGVSLQPECLRMVFSILWFDWKVVTVYGKRGELADKVAKLLVDRAHLEASEALTNDRKDWIEI